MMSEFVEDNVLEVVWSDVRMDDILLGEYDCIFCLCFFGEGLFFGDKEVILCCICVDVICWIDED